jgi:hypothetical protein
MVHKKNKTYYSKKDGLPDPLDAYIVEQQKKKQVNKIVDENASSRGLSLPLPAKKAPSPALHPFENNSSHSRHSNNAHSNNYSLSNQEMEESAGEEEPITATQQNQTDSHHTHHGHSQTTQLLPNQQQDEPELKLNRSYHRVTYPAGPGPSATAATVPTTTTKPAPQPAQVFLSSPSTNSSSSNISHHHHQYQQQPEQQAVHLSSGQPAGGYPFVVIQQPQLSTSAAAQQGFLSYCILDQNGVEVELPGSIRQQ